MAVAAQSIEDIEPAAYSIDPGQKAWSNLVTQWQSQAVTLEDIPGLKQRIAQELQRLHPMNYESFCREAVVSREMWRTIHPVWTAILDDLPAPDQAQLLYKQVSSLEQKMRDLDRYGGYCTIAVGFGTGVLGAIGAWRGMDSWLGIDALSYVASAASGAVAALVAGFGMMTTMNVILNRYSRQRETVAYENELRLQEQMTEKVRAYVEKYGGNASEEKK